MAGKMEELPTDPSKNQTDLETALTLARSNHQVAQRDARGRIKAHLREWQGRRPAKSTPPSTTSRFFSFPSLFCSSSTLLSNTPLTTSTNPTHAALAYSSTMFISIPALLPPFTSGPSTTSGSGSASPPPPPGLSDKEKL
ncbi:hypothetical protein M422DRAFT_269860 [Sphaerobolus stellatus SS14]|uniref:Uncharacterized protein n=1 Tax=Sphaerobolus stellatus (strain SS14) TaxID=990650 RepID=A0A0C9U3N5_SPHS4|nr:hypothetical protein M422DRAFT_269860 [Sphaerobolus stellatus SS14]